SMAGMAPACKLVSYKVLDDDGNGETSAIIAALQDIQRVNSNGRDIKIHGVNLSVGYAFDPLWFACGESPLCVEVTRLVKPGVVGPVGYVEDSGTSMAAAHVSGVIAGFLSIRREYIGRAEDVKKIFTGTATDLGRVPQFQGAGLVDLMRAIQSV